MTSTWNTVERQWNTKKNHKSLLTINLRLSKGLAFLIPRELKSKSIIDIENIINIKLSIINCQLKKNGTTEQTYYLHGIVSK